MICSWASISLLFLRFLSGILTAPSFVFSLKSIFVPWNNLSQLVNLVSPLVPTNMAGRLLLLCSDVSINNMEEKNNASARASSFIKNGKNEKKNTEEEEKNNQKKRTFSYSFVLVLQHQRAARPAAQTGRDPCGVMQRWWRCCRGLRVCIANQAPMLMVKHLS